MGRLSRPPGWLRNTANPEVSRYPRISRFSVSRLRSTDCPRTSGQNQNNRADSAGGVQPQHKKNGGPPWLEIPGMADLREWLKLDARRNLARAVAAEIGASGTGDLSVGIVVYPQYRIRQIHVVEDVGERAFDLHPQPLGNRK